MPTDLVLMTIATTNTTSNLKGNKTMTNAFHIKPIKNDTRFDAIIAEQNRRLLLAREEKTASDFVIDEREFCFESGSTYTFKMGRYGQEVEVHVLRRTAKFIYFKHPVTGVTTRREVKRRKAYMDNGLGIRSDNTFHFVVLQKPYEYIESRGSHRAADIRCDALYGLARADWDAQMDRTIEEGVEFAKTLPASGIYA